MTFLRNIIRNKYLQLAILLLFSLIIIFYKFGLIPRYLFFDEVEFAKLALSLREKTYSPYSSLATGHPTLYFYVILIFFKLFGVYNNVLRLPAAFFGVLNIIIFYFIMRKFYSGTLSFILAIFLISCRWYFNFARFSFEATFLLFLELSALLFLLQVRKKNKLLMLMLSAISTGLAFNSYYPGRIFFLLPLFYLLLSKEKIKNILLYFLIVIILILPLLLYFRNNPDLRFNQESFITSKTISLAKKFSYLEQNIVKTSLMFSFKGDMNGRHNYTGKPALNIILGSFFIFGLILTIFNLNNIFNQFFLFYFFLSLFPTIFAYPAENPNMLRTFTVLPSLIFFIGNSLNFIYQKVKIKKHYLISIFFLLAACSAFLDLRTYFLFQSRVFLDDAFKVKGELQTILKVKNF